MGFQVSLVMLKREMYLKCLLQRRTVFFLEKECASSLIECVENVTREREGFSENEKMIKRVTKYETMRETKTTTTKKLA